MSVFVLSDPLPLALEPLSPWPGHHAWARSGMEGASAAAGEAGGREATGMTRRAVAGEAENELF